MDRPKASHGKPRSPKGKARGACVRIGTDGSAAGSGFAAFWLTPAEAKLLREELDAAIRKAEDAAIRKAEGLAIFGAVRPEAA